MTPTEKIDSSLDAVLKASWSSMKMFKNEIILEGMRAAMHKVMVDSYAEGLKGAQDAMVKIKEPF